VKCYDEDIVAWAAEQAQSRIGKRKSGRMLWQQRLQKPAWRIFRKIALGRIKMRCFWMGGCPDDVGQNGGFSDVNADPLVAWCLTHGKPNNGPSRAEYLVQRPIEPAR
jgi:hypothetical protein